MTLAGNVMANPAVPATALLRAILPVAIRRTLLIAVDAGPTPRAHAVTVEWVACGLVLTLTVQLAISAPFSQRAPCSHTRDRELKLNHFVRYR